MFRKVYDGYKVSREGTVLGRRGNPLVPSDNGRGYPIVSVIISGKRTSKTLHRIVAEAWIPNPENLSDVNHLDCDKWNCHVDNLEWCTHGYNIAYSYKMANRSATGVDNARAIADDEEVHAICRLLSSGNSAAGIRNMGYDYNRVRAIKAGKNWTHISNKYVF